MKNMPFLAFLMVQKIMFFGHFGSFLAQKRHMKLSFGQL
jgi:hypothetical protein